MTYLFENTEQRNIVAPAMMAWSYSVDNETLRDMYAKLLAHAAIKDQQAFLHPCFVEIIKQMHPDEAQFFKYIFAKKQNCSFEYHVVCII